MRVLVTGSTGFIGQALIARLRQDNHDVIAWVRSPKRAEMVLGRDITFLQACSNMVLPDGIDAIINLAGEPIVDIGFDMRWSPSKRARILNSRVQTTQQLVRAMACMQHQPRVFISASAVGIYGARGDTLLNEQSSYGNDFLADVCIAWESAAKPVKAAGVRLVILRIGIVLGAEGGIIKNIGPVFRCGLGGPWGSGQQYMSWIHRDDVVNIMLTSLYNQHYQGVFNAVAPNPVRNSEFVATLARLWHRPARIKVPTCALRVVLGDAAGPLCTSERVACRALQDKSYAFACHTLEDALTQL